MYDGTITQADPNLVTTFELDAQTRAYVIRDVDAQLPDWDAIGNVYRVGYDHPRYDDVAISTGRGPDVDVIRSAWDRFADVDTVTRYLRMFWDVVDVEISDMIGPDYKAWSLVTRGDVEEWGTPAESVPGIAGEALDIYRQWAEGEVYGVVVVNTVTGAEESLWDVYDSSPDLIYCHEVAVEIAPIGVKLDGSEGDAS